MLSLTPTAEPVRLALLTQYDLERYSVAIYHALSASFSNLNWDGFSKWMYKNGDEEATHAKKIFDHLSDRNVNIVVGAVPQPAISVDTIIGLFDLALEHEKRVTASLCDVWKVAFENSDQMALALATDMITEQIEEEKKVFDVLFKLTVAGSNVAAILEIQEELNG